MHFIISWPHFCGLEWNNLRTNRHLQKTNRQPSASKLGTWHLQPIHPPSPKNRRQNLKKKASSIHPPPTKKGPKKLKKRKHVWPIRPTHFIFVILHTAYNFINRHILGNYRECLQLKLFQITKSEKCIWQNVSGIQCKLTFPTALHCTWCTRQIWSVTKKTAPLESCKATFEIDQPTCFCKELLVRYKVLHI